MNRATKTKVSLPTLDPIISTFASAHEMGIRTLDEMGMPILDVHAQGVHQKHMALVVDIKRQVSGRGSRALSHPSPE